MDDRRVQDLHQGVLRAATAALTAGALLWVTQGIAEAAPTDIGPCGKASSIVVSICSESPGKSASPGKAKDGSAPGKKGKSKKTSCPVKRLPKQPPANSPLWDDHDPSQGAIYWRTCSTGDNTSITFFAEEPPVAEAVDPAVVAQEAVDKMRLEGPKIESPRASGKYTVGVPVWMHAGAGQTRFGPTSASASAGSVTVNATAKVSKIAWSMGDGTSVTCSGRGAVYRDSYGLRESPDCGHTYSKVSKGSYTVTATSTWAVEWEVEGTGEGGTLEEVRETQVDIPVGEGQVVGG